MPVNRFLRFGGEFAVDVTDRVSNFSTS